MKSKPTKLLIFRDIVRILFILSFFFLPDFTEDMFGVEIELENEYIVLAAIVIFGTYWCGWFCPFGHAQYYAGIVGKKCFPHMQLSIPKSADKYLRYLKYVFLVMFLYIFFGIGEHSYFGDHFDMYQSTWYSHAYLMLKKPWAIMIIPLFIPRFFCKYLCYQKAGYQIINRIFPFLSIQRNKATCTECTKCTTECPMDIDLANSTKVSGGECVGCLKCIDQSGCPTEPSSLQLEWLGKTVNPLKFSLIAMFLYVIATFIIIFGFGSFH